MGKRGRILTPLTTSKNISCKGMCKRYLNKRNGRKELYYSKWENCRCSVCDEYLKWDGVYCPCCGYKLRRRPRGAKSAQIVLKIRGIKRIG